MPHIAIAGAGIAGLATAILFKRQGKQVSVFDHVIDPTPVGAGLLLQPSGQAILQQLGLLEQIRKHAAIVRSLQGYTGQLHSLDLHYQHLDEQAHGLGIHRANLHKILWDCAREMAIPISLGQDVQSFSQTTQHVHVQIEGKEHVFDALVIANGARSQLRTQLPIKQTCRPYPWGAFWCVIDKEDWPFPDILMQRYRGAHIMFGVLPTGQNPVTGRACYSLFWSLPKSEFKNYQEAGHAVLIERMKQVWPEVATWFADYVQAHPNTPIAIAEYADVRMQTWHHQRCVVIGDAAHAMSPQLGQGANMALIDAAVLANTWETRSDIPSVFEDYSKRRKRHIAYYQLSSHIMTPLYQSHYPLGWLRDWGTMIGRRIPIFYRQYLLTLNGAKTGFLDLRAQVQDLL
jgi:2-polyprenyl-6-methoxyphenol hydroxylase-like FAD-dependent oxidoreductase